jgi:hypothetical protein
LTSIRTFEIQNYNGPAALLSAGAFIFFFVSALSGFHTSSIPQFWLALIGGFGLLVAPAYAARCYYMIIYEPDSYTEHREGKLR